MSNLPPEASTVRAIYPRAAWSGEEHMLAAVIDTLAVGNWQRAGKKSAPKPKPIRRPGEKAPMGTTRTKADFDAMYARALANVAEREAAGEVVWQSK